MKVPTLSLIRRSVVTLTFVAAAFTLGCANPKHPDPSEAFDMLTQRSMAEDAAYVRTHLSPELIETAKEEGTDVESDAFVREIMAELQVCKPQGWEKTDTDQRVRVDVAGIKPGRVHRKHYDMVFDKKHGWMLATRAYGEQPLKSPPAGDK